MDLKTNLAKVWDCLGVSTMVFIMISISSMSIASIFSGLFGSGWGYCLGAVVLAYLNYGIKFTALNMVFGI